MFQKFKITEDDFVAWGIEEIKTLMPASKVVQTNWNQLKNNIKSGKVWIRGYGRDKKNGKINKIQELYDKAKFNVHICLDRTNNERPKKLMKRIIKYKVSKTDTQNHKAIQNYRISHLWGYTKNIYLFENPWNIIYTPIVIDPLTGHETPESKLKMHLKDKIYNLIYQKYGCFIDEYNNILEKDKRIKNIIEICENHKGDRFYEEMKKQWTKLTKENILQG